MPSKPWQEIVQAKRDLRAKLLKPYLNSVNGEHKNDLAILNISEVTELTSLFAQGTLRAHDVIQCYVKKAASAHQLTNCLTEICFDEAIEEASRLDEYFQVHGRLRGPLHGVPITLKDQFNVEGYDSTLGYVGRSYVPAKEDAVIVKALKSLGAVVIAKTNLPQSIMWCETDNPLWGLTTNPLNADFTPGGSTGGEACLLALIASMVGWGTDIGGSIRIPSHMNGLWGLKPTSSRLSYLGVPVSTEGQEHVPSSVGPMTRSLSSLTTVMRELLNSRCWVLDPKVVPIPWRQTDFDEIQSRPLTIGVLLDDGVVKVHPPIERVLKALVTKLEAAGHEIVQWDCSGHRECIEIMDQFYTVDGGKDIRRAVEAGGEPFIPHVEALIGKGPAISVYQYWQLNRQKLAAQQAYNKKWNTIKGSSGRHVDVLLVPTMPHTAVLHRTCRWVGYTKVWNFLDYTALSFPAGTVQKDLDAKSTEGYVSRNDYDAWNSSLYDLDAMDGHPVGLQLVGRRFEEEKVLGAAAVVEKLASLRDDAV